MSDDLTNHFHKVLALLMYEFEITEFEVTEESLAEFTREYGERPALTHEQVGGVLRFTLMPADAAKRLVQ